MQYAPYGVETKPQVSATPTIGLDMYPANVTSSDGLELKKVKVLGITGRGQTDDVVLIYRGTAAGPVLVAADKVVGSSRDGQRRTIELDDGTSLTVEKAKGCGCGSTLKHFRPFPTGSYGRGW